VDSTSKTIPAIDVHSHYVPEGYRKALEEAGRLSTDIFALPKWGHAAASRGHGPDEHRRGGDQSLLA
jgi:hypothetical protein